MTARAHALGLAAVALCLVIARGVPAAAQDVQPREQAKRLPLVTLSGEQTKFEGRAIHRLADAKSFREIYMRHLGHDPADFDEFYNPHGVPEINFEECIVVAVFQGDSWNSAGVYVDSILEDENRVTVRYDDRSYQTSGPDGGGRQVRPYGFFVVPRTDKMLVLEENVQNIIGQPPLWKERIRIPPPGVW